MAIPDSPEAGQAEDHSAGPGPLLPGYTVDALRTQGKPAEARAEFERLLQEGADSGIDTRPPATIFDAARAEISNRLAAHNGEAPQSGDTAGVEP